MEQPKKPKIVTRVIDYEYKFDRDSGGVNYTAFYRHKDIENGSYSVCCIDDFKSNKEIYDFSDKYILSNPPAIARADLKVKEVEKIIFQNFKLKVVYAPTKNNNYHYNIENVPTTPQSAKILATILADISNLNIRNP